GSSRAEWLGFRALARLAGGRPREALADANASMTTAPTPRADRLRVRALLALGRFESLRLSDPNALAALPLQGPSLRADLRRLADAPVPAMKQGARRSPEALVGRLNRAVALARLGRAREAVAEATAVVEDAPTNTRSRQALAQILLACDRRPEASEEIERALAIDPESPALWVLRARLAILSSDPNRALSDLERARSLGTDGSDYRATRAAAMLASGDPRQAVQEWTLALGHDAEDPSAFLGRARAFLASGQYDAAIADLEQAAAWAEGRLQLALPIALAYARCLPHRPALWSRVHGLARSAWTGRF
ncbi:MAG: tetratricopeptide repeat protein, partial [Isosphaeraceae bacterium]